MSTETYARAAALTELVGQETSDKVRNALGEALDGLKDISAADAQELDAALSPTAAIAADMVMKALREARCSCPVNHDRVVETHADGCWRPFLDAMIRKSERGEKR